MAAFGTIIVINVVLFNVHARVMARKSKVVVNPGWWLFLYIMHSSLMMVLGVL